MKKGSLVKHGGGWFPADDETKELQKRFKQGEELIVEFVKKRNPRFHRYAFRALQFMYECADVDVPFDPWRKDLLILAGYKKVYGFPDGRVLVEAESLKYESMDEVKFHRVFNDLVQAFLDHYGQKISYDQVMEVATL